MSENNINKEINNDQTSQKPDNDLQNRQENPENTKPVSQGRRDALKALATVPVLGAMAYGVYKKRKNELVHRSAADMFRFPSEIPQYVPSITDGQTIRLGIIGSGIRGKQLMEALGFATPENVQNLIELNLNDSKTPDIRIFLNKRISI